MENDSNTSESDEAYSIYSSDSQMSEYGEIKNQIDDDDDGEELYTKAAVNVEYMTSQQVLTLMKDEISEVKSVIELPENETKQLLNYFKWDKMKLLESFYEDGREKLFKLANIKHTSWQDESVLLNNDHLCEICFEGSDCIKLSCGHDGFCNVCFEKYLNSRILEGVGDGLTCPAFKCDYVLGDAVILKLIKSPEIRDKYQCLITSTFVTHHRLLTYCPQPLCTNVVKSEIVMTTVECKCGHSFCFKCGETMHEPVLCEILERWERLVKSDGGSKKWIYKNTKVSCHIQHFLSKYFDQPLSPLKPCPSCNTPIQKNGGCNHMFCHLCKTDFCWVCMKSTKEHYACGERVDMETLSGSSNLEDYNLDFYTDVYENNKMSLRLEQGLLNSDQTRADWVTCEFIKEAAIVLFKNRRVLMYSFVFAYYIDANNHKAILEENLENLRKATEELSGILERDVNEKTIGVMEQAVKDKIRYCDTRRKMMIDFVREGYDQNYWKERV
jgi:ariadne-1